MAASSSPKNRGWLSSGRKLHVIPSKVPVPAGEEKVYSSSPTKKMRQVGKSKSEKEKMKIYASSQDLGLRNTKWHISLPNIPNTQDLASSDGASASPKRNIVSPLPPPPSNPPPILNQVSDNDTYSKGGRGLVKSVSAGAINIVSPARAVGKLQGVVKPVTTNNTEDKTVDANGKYRKGPPPKVPPPYLTKARAVTVVPVATQDHPQSSTRSAPGGLLNSDESESNAKLTASDRFASSRVRAETAVVDDPIAAQSPLKLCDPPATSADSESQLTASMEGGVKSLARFFSARSKEGVTVQSASPKHPNVLRPVKGRQNLKSVLQKASSIPETGKEEMGTSTEKRQFRRLPPIHSISSNDSDEKYEVLQNVGSMVSTGSPTHMSIFSWYNPAPDSKFGVCDISKRRYQNVFDDESFACFDKTGLAKKGKESSTSPKSPYKEYQNIFVETATLEETPSDVPSPKEGSHKEKKPIPLPRTQSKDRGMAPQKNRGRHLVTSSSEGSLSLSVPHSTSDNRNSEYVDMAKELEYSSEAVKDAFLQGVEQPPKSPGIIVLGSMDPEWRERYEELIEKEIEMMEGFSDSDEPTEDIGGHEQLTAQSKEKAVVTPPPFIPVKKSLLKKTQSHNPNEPNICRRNTPKEKRELRKGVCSDSDHLGPNEELEVDDYVPMQSAQSPESVNNTPLPSLSASDSHSEITSSLTVSKPAPGLHPQSGPYYLQIIPSPPLMVKPAEDSVKAVTPTPVKHYYIEIDIPDDQLDESEQKKVQKDVSNNPTLPPKSSPTHTTGRVVEVTPNGKRKLKYRKVDVVPATHTTITSDAKRKTPYSRVKVDTDTEPTAIDSTSRAALEKERLQGSIFAKEMMNYMDRPLPPTPSENGIYYRTVNHPLGPVPAIRQVWHQYIEIDEEELNKKSQAPHPRPSEGWINIHAVGGPVRVHQTKQRSLTTLPPPPPIPKRPSCPYVEIDGEGLGEMADSLSDAAGVGPRAPRILGAHPGRQDNTGRQRSLSSSGEYAYPVIPGLKLEWMNLQKDGGKAYFTPRVPVLGTSHAVRQNATSGKTSLMETITERREPLSDQPPSLPPKTESLLREQQGLTTKQSAMPSPYLVPVTSAKTRKLSAPAIFSHSISPIPSPEPKRPKSPKEVTTKEPINDDRREDRDMERRDRANALPSHLMQRKKAMNPPRQPPPYQVSPETKGQPPKIPQKKRTVSRKHNNSVSPATTPDSKSHNRELGSSPIHDTKKLPPDTLTVRKPGLQHRIDRNSLAMIMRNKSAIAKQLEKENDSPKSQRKQIFATEESESDVSVVRSLGDILLDVDALLQHHMCTEDDLIAAIEKQLHIKLVKKKVGLRDRKQTSDETYKQSDGSVLEDSVQVTEQDVQEVVTFMNKSQEKQLSPKDSPSEPPGATGEGEREAGDGWMASSVIVNDGPQDRSPGQDLSPTKQRSSPFIVTQSRQTYYTESPTVKPHFPVTQKVSPPNTYDRLASPVDDQSAGDEEDGVCEDSEKSMRDGRSSSVGLKPLRRVRGVKDRRKSNPACDMVNLGAATNHFTQGTGVFTSRGGTLTNLTSEVEIQVPKGAVLPGKKQKLWFEVIQKVYDTGEENKDISLQSLSQDELSDSNSSTDGVESVRSERKKRTIQLSTMVLIGPSDAKFEQPIKIKMPHCLPYRNNSWHLHLQARAQNCESDDWMELSNSSGLIIPQYRQRQRYFKDSTYQMHLHYAVVRTREMGCFKLCGSPMRNGSHSAKRMVASIFSKQESGKLWSVLVTLSNAIHDQIQALDYTQRKAGYMSLEYSVPVLCFGEGKDLELSLCAESNSLPLATQVIPFGQFWRLERVGRARAIFPVGLDQVEMSKSKTLTLKIQQAGSKLLHETNFVLAG